MGKMFWNYLVMASKGCWLWSFIKVIPFVVIQVVAIILVLDVVSSFLFRTPDVMKVFSLDSYTEGLNPLVARTLGLGFLFYCAAWTISIKDTFKYH